MTRTVYYTVETSGEGLPTRCFLLHPDGRLEPDDRSCEEMAQAAMRRADESSGAVECNVSFVDNFSPGCSRAAEAARRAAVPLLRRDLKIASPFDVEVDLRHRVVLYRK